jgi:hypothetical protein
MTVLLVKVARSSLARILFSKSYSVGKFGDPQQCFFENEPVASYLVILLFIPQKRFLDTINLFNIIEVVNLKLNKINNSFSS